MNAYLVIEDGQVKIWIAPTMSRALEIAWDAYAKELDSYESESDSTPEEDREEYEQSILQSCELMGEVGNP